MTLRSFPFSTLGGYGWNFIFTPSGISLDLGSNYISEHLFSTLRSSEISVGYIELQPWLDHGFMNFNSYAFLA